MSEREWIEALQAAVAPGPFTRSIKSRWWGQKVVCVFEAGMEDKQTPRATLCHIIVYDRGKWEFVGAAV